MNALFKWTLRLCEGIAAALLAAIFFIFLLQIGSRYTPRLVAAVDLQETLPALAAIEPLGWTLEMIGILWVWVIFFSCAFVVREWDHVKFDILYLAVPRKVRAVFAILSAVAIVAGMLYAFLPTWDYIDWMKMRKTATVRNPFTSDKIPLRTVFSVYGAFMLVVAARYAWLAVETLRHGPPKTELEIALDDAAADRDPTATGDRP